LLGRDVVHATVVSLRAERVNENETATRKFSDVEVREPAYHCAAGAAQPERGLRVRCRCARRRRSCPTASSRLWTRVGCLPLPNSHRERAAEGRKHWLSPFPPV